MRKLSLIILSLWTVANTTSATAQQITTLQSEDSLKTEVTRIETPDYSQYYHPELQQKYEQLMDEQKKPAEETKQQPTEDKGFFDRVADTVKGKFEELSHEIKVWLGLEEETAETTNEQVEEVFLPPAHPSFRKELLAAALQNGTAYNFDEDTLQEYIEFIVNQPYERMNANLPEDFGKEFSTKGDGWAPMQAGKSVKNFADRKALIFGDSQLDYATAVDVEELRPIVDRIANLIPTREASTWQTVDEARGTAEQIVFWSTMYDVDPYSAAAMFCEESNFNKDAVSPAGYVGLAQIDKKKEEYYGTDAKDSEQAIETGVLYLKENLVYFNGNPVYAHSAYNAGAQDVRESGGIPVDKSDETAKHTKNILAITEKLHRGIEHHDATNPEHTTEEAKIEDKYDRIVSRVIH